MDTQIPNLAKINIPMHGDDRGFFKEVLRESLIKEKSGIDFKLQQVNHSRSVKDTLRGIHIAPWNKIIYVTRGVVQSVIVDTRKDSPTFGKYESVMLGEDTKTCLVVPAFCGNSYLVLSEDADYIYLTDQEWAPGLEKGVMWNDPKLNISWQIDHEPLLSEKDKTNPSFEELFQN